MSECILIVEDDAIAQLTLTQYLLDLGFPHSVVVNNGKDAMSALESEPVTLVFMDIRIMGEWDGITTAQRMKERNPKLPLIFLTANTDQDTLRRAQRVDPFSVIRKPYDRDTLFSAISGALDRAVAPPPPKEAPLPSVSTPEAPDVGVSVTNAAGTLVSVNAAFCRIHRCTESEAVGRTFTDFFPENIRKFATHLHQEFTAGRTEEGGGPWTIVDQHGALRPVSMTTSRLFLNEHQRYKISTFIDTSQQRADAEQLETILEKKDAFAREIHHRVKNNLNVISGLFYLQAEKIKDRPEVYHLFQESISRIRAMSVVHEQLYDYDDYTTIDVSRYVQLLADSVQSTYQNADYVTVRTQVAPIRLDVDRAVACGLILNEVMTNSFKYAFVGQPSDAKVLIKGFCRDRTLTLTVEDNGVGLPSDFNVDQARTLGVQLVKTLTEQLEGTLNMQNVQPQGTRVHLTFAI